MFKEKETCPPRDSQEGTQVTRSLPPTSLQALSAPLAPPLPPDLFLPLLPRPPWLQGGLKDRQEPSEGALLANGNP